MSDMEAATEALESVGGEEAPVESQEGAVSTAEADVVEAGDEPFFTWKNDSGEETIYRNKGELATFLKQSGMRHADLERSKQEIAEQRKYLEELRKKAETSSSANDAAYAKYKSWEDAIGKYPGLNEEMGALVDRFVKGGQSTAQNPDVSALQERLDAMEKANQTREQQQKSEAAKAKAIERLSGEFEDFDAEAVNQLMEFISQSPEEDVPYQLHKLFYQAHKGQTSLGELERKAAMKQSVNPSVTSSPATKQKGVGATPKTRKEEDELAASILNNVK